MMAHAQDETFQILPQILPHKWWISFVLHVASHLSSYTECRVTLPELLHKHESLPLISTLTQPVTVSSSKRSRPSRPCTFVWRSAMRQPCNDAEEENFENLDDISDDGGDGSVRLEETIESRLTNHQEADSRGTMDANSHQRHDLPDSCLFIELLIDFIEIVASNDDATGTKNFENYHSPGVCLRLGAMTRRGYCLTSEPPLRATPFAMDGPSTLSTTTHDRRGGHITEADIRGHFAAVGFDLLTTPPDVLARLWVDALNAAISCMPEHDAINAQWSGLNMKTPAQVQKSCWIECPSDLEVSVNIPLVYPDARDVVVWCLRGRYRRGGDVTEFVSGNQCTRAAPSLANPSMYTTNIDTRLSQIPAAALSMCLRCLCSLPPIPPTDNTLGSRRESSKPQDPLQRNHSLGDHGNTTTELIQLYSSWQQQQRLERQQRHRLAQNKQLRTEESNGLVTGDDGNVDQRLVDETPLPNDPGSSCHDTFLSSPSLVKSTTGAVSGHSHPGHRSTAMATTVTTHCRGQTSSASPPPRRKKRKKGRLEYAAHSDDDEN